MPKILYLSPFGRKSEPSTGRVVDFDSIYFGVKAFVSEKIKGSDVYRHDERLIAGKIDIFSPIEEADIVVCDITTGNANCLYEFGYAHGKGKPTVLITAKSGPVPYDLNMQQILAYDPDNIDIEFLKRLVEIISLVLSRPEEFRVSSRQIPRPKKIFLSYSHKDKQFLERILVHLKPLESAGLMDTWVDTRLKAGDRWKENIEAALQSASVAVLLVSADFLASDFIVKNELPPMLAKAERDGTRIIPIVLKPCRFSREPNLSIFQSLNSPDLPLSRLDESECENIYDQLAQTLEDSVRST